MINWFDFNEPSERLRSVIAEHRVVLLTSLTLLVIGLVSGAIIGLNRSIIVLLVAAVVAPNIVSPLRSGRRRGETQRRSALRTIGGFGLSAIAVFGVIQLVPYGREHSNPPVTMEPAWSTPETRELMVRACFGCHSNEVRWPTYSKIAPFSWAVTQHVLSGRDAINYSEFGSVEKDDESIEETLEGSMPPRYYTVFGLHPEANLTDAEVDALVAGLRNTPGFVEDDD